MCVGRDFRKEATRKGNGKVPYPLQVRVKVRDPPLTSEGVCVLK